VMEGPMLLPAKDRPRDAAIVQGAGEAGKRREPLARSASEGVRPPSLALRAYNHSVFRYSITARRSASVRSSP
jgi:hypothetical protein